MECLSLADWFVQSVCITCVGSRFNSLFTLILKSWFILNTKIMWPLAVIILSIHTNNFVALALAKLHRLVKL